MAPKETARHALLRRLEQRVRDVSAGSCTSSACLLGALADVEEQHARAYAGLPVVIPSDVNDAARRVAPELARVSLAFEQFVAATAAANARVAPALRAAVGDALDELRSKHESRATLLLAELDEALEKEHAYAVACQGLRAAAEPADGGTKAGTEQLPSDEDRVAASRARQLQRKRNTERRTIAGIVERLREEDGRRVAALGRRTADALQSYSTLIKASRRHIAELRDELRVGHERDIKNRERERAESNQSGQTSGRGGSDGAESDEEQHARASETCEVFVAMLDWLNGIFERMAPMEDGVVQRLRKMERANRAARLMVTTTTCGLEASDQSESTEPATAVGVVEVPKLVGALAEYHHMRTVSLLDPISRTLKFTRRKLSSAHRELFDAFSDTQRRVSRARAKLEARCARLPPHDARDWLFAVTATSTISDAKARSGDGLGASLTNFAIRGAANGKSTRVARSSLAATASLSAEWSAVLDELEDENNSVSASREDEESDDGTPELEQHQGTPKDQDTTGSESEGRAGGTELSSKDVDKVMTALDHYRTLHSEQNAQRVDMVRSLRSTTSLAVNTMELMIQDHCKHLDAALSALESALQQAHNVAPADPMESASNLKRSDALEPLLDELLSAYAPVDLEAINKQGECGEIVATKTQEATLTCQKLRPASSGGEWWVQACSAMRTLLTQWWASELEAAGCRTAWPCWLILAALLLVRICFHATSLEVAIAETSTLQRENGADLLRLAAVLRRSA